MKNSASAGTAAPSMEKSIAIKIQVNYNKLVNLCLALSFVAIVLFAIGYLKHSDRLTFLALGMMASALLFHIGLNPITKEEEDENGEYL
jgi:Zn-dependent membrane protease YugP